LSVVIPTYNRNDLLDRTLSSLACQSLDKSLIEVIVADDGSSENTRQVVDRYTDKITIKYHYQEHRGFRAGAARNMGIENAVGDILVFVDAGIVLGSACLEGHLTTHLRSTGDIAVLGYVMALQVKDHERNLIIRRLDHLAPDGVIGELLKRRVLGDVREVTYRICADDISGLPAPWALFWSGNCSARREAILNAGMFDSNFDGRWGMEDIDLGYRLYQNKVGFQLCRDAISYHYPHACSRKDMLSQEAVNKRYFLSKFDTVESRALARMNPVRLNPYLISRDQRRQAGVANGVSDHP